MLHCVIIDRTLHSLIIQKNFIPGTSAKSCSFVILNCSLTVNYKHLQSSEAWAEGRKGCSCVCLGQISQPESAAASGQHRDLCLEVGPFCDALLG